MVMTNGTKNVIRTNGFRLGTGFSSSQSLSAIHISLSAFHWFSSAGFSRATQDTRQILTKKNWMSLLGLHSAQILFKKGVKNNISQLIWNCNSVANWFHQLEATFWDVKVEVMLGLFNISYVYKEMWTVSSTGLKCAHLSIQRTKNKKITN